MECALCTDHTSTPHTHTYTARAPKQVRDNVKLRQKATLVFLTFESRLLLVQQPANATRAGRRASSKATTGEHRDQHQWDAVGVRWMRWMRA